MNPAAGYLSALRNIAKHLIVSFLVLFTGNSFANLPVIDSLEHLLVSKNITDSVRIDILLQLGSAYLPVDAGKARSVAVRSIDLAEKTGDQRLRQAFILFSQAHLADKKYREAIKVIERLIETDKGTKDQKYLGEDWVLLGNIYLEQKDHTKSLDYLEKAALFFKTTGDNKKLTKVYEKMIEVYTAKNDFRQVYEYSRLLGIATDSIIKQENQNRLDTIKSKYETEKKEAEIVLLNINNELKAYEIKQYAVTRNTFIIAFILILIVAILLLRMILLRRRSNRLLREKNNRINMQKREVEMEKDVLENYSQNLQKENILAQYETLKNQVNPHFLFNSLSSLSLLIESDPHKAIEFTTEFSKVYRYVLELKENLVIKVMEELSLINSYLFLQEIRFEKNLTVSIDIKSEYLDCFIPPFSLQLLIDNVIKHNTISAKFPLKINIYSENDFLIVRNNIGKQPEKVISTGIGIKNLLDRYNIVSEIPPQFDLTETEYIAKIPVIRED